MKNTFIALAIGLPAVFSVTSPVHAFSLSFSDGIAEFSDLSSGGFLAIKNVINNSGEVKTDVHLNISYLDDAGNPDPNLNRTFEADFSAPLPNGGTYSFESYPWPNNGSIIYTNMAILKAGYEPDNSRVRLSGYFTPQVPGPLPVLGLGVAFGFSRSIRRRMGESATH